MITKYNGLSDKIAEKTSGIKVKIIVQQDNAKPHIGKKNREIINILAGQRNLNIEFQNQPSQSPDLNRLYLCFFHSLKKQRKILKRKCNTYEELIDSCQTAFANYIVEKLKKGSSFAVCFLHGTFKKFWKKWI